MPMQAFDTPFQAIAVATADQCQLSMVVYPFAGTKRAGTLLNIHLRRNPARNTRE
jgi:hypothetical protein